MNKWLIAFIVGFLLFAVSLVALIYFKEQYVGQVAVWQMEARQLSFSESLGLAFFNFVNKYALFLVGLNFIFWTGISFIAAAVFKKT